MHVLLLIAQLSAAIHRPLTPSDSAALQSRVERAEFQYLMDWRYLWQTEMNDLKLGRRAHPRPSPPAFDAKVDLKRPGGNGCIFESVTMYNLDAHDWMAHYIESPQRPKLSVCPTWNRPNWYEPPDERRSIDASLTSEGVPPSAADSAMQIRRHVLVLLDSAATLLPGDGWLVGQRVRLHLDQTEVGAARQAAAECRAQAWWCAALTGYVQFTAGDVSRASSTFDQVRALMPDSLRCVWGDASMFFNFTGRQAYDRLTCAQRDSVNERVWWLADPLYLENGNERRTEHYARHVLIELHQALDADERFDWRDGYQGPALREMIMRYGWPTQIVTWDSMPMRWHDGNSHSMFLGDSTITIAGRIAPAQMHVSTWCSGTALYPVFLDPSTARRGSAATVNGIVSCCSDDKKKCLGDTPSRVSCPDGEGANDPPPDFICNPYILVPGIKYWGTQFHTVPLWETVLDPFHATDQGWDLAPPRDAGPYWDTSWWPTEFFRRDRGPLVPLSTQVAFFRRQNSAVLAAAMAWDTVTYIPRPPDRMVGAVIVTTGPNSPLTGVQDTMSGRAPHPLVTPVASGPALLSVEMVPRESSGPAGRTRFGIDAPAPLRTVAPGELALSDVVLVSATIDQSAPTTLVAMLPRMLGSTVLRDPNRVALFWELYGLGTGDTVNVSLHIVRKNEDNALQRLGALVGIGRKGDDSVAVRWTEPRPGDPTATLEGGVTIRPRGLVVDMSVLSAGQYQMEIAVQRGISLPVTTTRTFRVERR